MWTCLSTHPHVGTSYKQRHSPSAGSPVRLMRIDAVFQVLNWKKLSPSSLFRARWIRQQLTVCSASPPRVSLIAKGCGWTLGGALLHEITHCLCERGHSLGNYFPFCCLTGISPQELFIQPLIQSSKTQIPSSSLYKYSGVIAVLSGAKYSYIQIISQ